MRNAEQPWYVLELNDALPSSCVDDWELKQAAFANVGHGIPEILKININFSSKIMINNFP